MFVGSASCLKAKGQRTISGVFCGSLVWQEIQVCLAWQLVTLLLALFVRVRMRSSLCAAHSQPADACAFLASL